MSLHHKRYVMTYKVLEMSRDRIRVVSVWELYYIQHCVINQRGIKMCDYLALCSYHCDYYLGVQLTTFPAACKEIVLHVKDARDPVWWRELPESIWKVSVSKKYIIL